VSWEYVALGDVADVFNGKTPAKKEQRDAGHPVLKIKDVNLTGLFKGEFQSFVDESLAEKFNAKKLIKDDTLILNAAHNADYVGSKQYRAESEVVGSLPTGEWLIARGREGQLCPRFLNYWLASGEARFKLKQLVKGIHLYPKDVMRLEIPLPPLKEQKRIAAILDKADNLRRKRQQAIDLADDFLRAVFLDMFGDPVTNPKGWAVQRMGDVSSKITDGTHKTPTYTSSGIQFLSAKNIRDWGIDWENTKYISQEEHEQLIKRCNPEVGDILLSKSGSLATPALIDVDKEFSLFESAALIKPIKERIHAVYLLHFLRSDSGKYLMLKSSKGVAIKHLHLTDLRQLEILVPPMDKQQRFVTLVNRYVSLVDKSMSSKSNVGDIFQSLSQKAFSGQLSGTTLVGAEREMDCPKA